MVREFSITIYLFIFRIIFSLCRLFPLQKKVVAVASFGDNIHCTVQALNNQTEDSKIVILKDRSCTYPFKEGTYNELLLFSLSRPLLFLKSIYHLATAKTILVDNYFGFLAVTNFKADTTCIQLWHATGALKNFGLKDPSIRNRSQKAYRRFRKVYKKFHFIVAGSEKMASTFRESFDVTNERIIRTGIPRTDLLFNRLEKKQVSLYFKQKYPDIKDRKIILYAPTYREGQLNDFHINMDLKKMYKELSNEYVLFIKLHPAIKNKLQSAFKTFMYDVSDYPDTNQLLIITDMLITDYSSIPFEYALFEKPMIFFAYDLETYKKERGLIDDYETEMPGPVVQSTEEIITVMKQDAFHTEKIKSFAKVWNQYSKGNSSERLAKFIIDLQTPIDQRRKASG
ncbi:CDP-glycerol--glycerophosphate glycerophosphotransferase [Virgibacillus dokdonensis]|uniref:CDP-glycerol--glycerophosphate glycerophosphotransferase n=1 Tax=Virgibacillus dokdonensis TaxID=302167 RepID=A0A3E0WPX7_9BACI|nr:CDP-glycerol--glycerophosphate glycerophosphotransferase [Virgibacillus dokdonensis]